MLQAESSKLVVRETEQFNVIVGEGATQEARCLSAGKTVPPGQLVCPVACMFFDDQVVIHGFLTQPGTEMYRDRVVAIHNVRRNGIYVAIWAVMVGAARFVA